ncbi:beta-N-acetylhexosaminidase [Alkalilimnicola sp. S0819]|uniref:beta-N-acetylhexosaminidase n=1 Tax=Alkalilimnicola sp. S0819 TaxID=2613922 RepID=UPI0012616742|nr:beta-N-acetylhexosaminidase [Alkalilimnicola sp. S0819]KAB7627453.1 beta-N-acetylhexosaminidase [Alkalilimnicola sp. S0819]MPQ15602.1 beta-N-acetylhexosaminidase [Alkalilimnicola sp. S0819]
MSLGQLMVGIAGTRLTAAETELLRQPKIGGVILFTRNYESVAQLRALCDEIHALRRPPLLIAVDQEGGRVQRFRGEFTELPPLADLGAAWDRDRKQALGWAEQSGWLMAAELRAVGVDLSFAPVLDLGRGVSSVIGDRAFHADPEAIGELAQAYVRGMHRAGMSATGKHFPGHGSVAPDSHLELPVDERRAEDLVMEDMRPFEQLCHTGLEGMMMAHVVYSQCDPKPGSFSAFWIEDVLRNQIGFQGAVFSDDLGMAGAAVIGDMPARARAALSAGCDMLLLCNELEQVEPVMRAMWAPEPVAAMRLARLHGRQSPDWATLRASREWAEARRAVDACARSAERQLNL